ncbi:hypothetical protein YTPLAS18_13240 [Nitrospira sp.]|nr:hypothetical protein YTPLAS18_13240 [Nitrospira sp.]
MGRLFWSVLLLAAGVLAQISPPNHSLWYVNLAVTEWGHWLIIPILLIWWPGWQAHAAGRVAASLALIAGVLVLMPAWKARSYAQVIESRAAQLLGSASLPVTADAPARPSAFVLRDLIQGVGTPSIDWSTQPYIKRGERELQMDVYSPPPGTPMVGTGSGHPVILVVHGGLMGPPWQAGDRQEALNLNRYLAARGYYVIAIDYRLATEAPYPGPLEDVLAVLDMLHGMGGTNQGGMDPTRVVIIGRGGGAHLALMAAYASRNPSIRGVVALYPPTDLPAWYGAPSQPRVADWQGWIHTFMGKPLNAESEALYQAASPRMYASSAPPTLLIHGARDPIVPPTQTERLTMTLRQSRRDVLSFQLPWATHSCDMNFHGPCGQATTYLIERFLARYAA